MDSWIVVLGIICSIVGTAVPVCGAFRYVVIKPLSKDILANTKATSKLSESVDKLHDKIEYVDRRREELQERVAIVEQSAKSAHHRLDNLQERVDHL